MARLLPGLVKAHCGAPFQALLTEAAPPSRPSRAHPSYLGISVRAEAPRAEPVPAWPYPNSWSGVIALQPVSVS